MHLVSSQQGHHPLLSGPAGLMHACLLSSHWAPWLPELTSTSTSQSSYASFDSNGLPSVCRYLPAVTQHCLQVFGKLAPVAQGESSMFDSSDNASQPSSDRTFALDPQQV